MMKLAIIDFSQEDDVCSRKLVGSFIDGLYEIGSDYNVFKIEELNILPCNECTKDIHFEYTNKCRCDDDMNKIYPQLKDYPNWVFVVPMVKSYTVTYLKNFLDRLEPMFQPLINMSNLPEFNIPQVTNNGVISLIATATSNNFENALVVEEELSSVSTLFSKNYAGSLLANNYEDLIDAKDDNPRLKSILTSVKRAGKEISTKNIFSVDTITNFSK